MILDIQIAVMLLKDFWNKNSGTIVFCYTVALLLVFIMPSPDVVPTEPHLHVDKLLHLILFAMYFVVWRTFFSI